MSGKVRRKQIASMLGSEKLFKEYFVE